MRRRRKGPKAIHHLNRRVLWVVEYVDPADRLQVEAIYASASEAHVRAGEERKLDKREGIDTQIRVTRYVPSPVRGEKQDTKGLRK